MEIILCDLCRRNEARERYRLKMRRKGFYLKGWHCNLWSDWQKIDICQECLNKLFNKNENENENTLSGGKEVESNNTRHMQGM